MYPEHDAERTVLVRPWEENVAGKRALPLVRNCMNFPSASVFMSPEKAAYSDAQVSAAKANRLGNELRKVVHSRPTYKRTIESLVSEQSNEAVRTFIKRWTEVASVTIPVDWIEEGCTPPSEMCRHRASDIVFTMFAKSNLVPKRVGASRDCGIFILYRNEKNGSELGIEVGNDAVAVAVLSTSKAVISSRTINDNWELTTLGRRFREPTTYSA